MREESSCFCFTTAVLRALVLGSLIIRDYQQIEESQEYQRRPQILRGPPVFAVILDERISWKKHRVAPPSLYIFTLDLEKDCSGVLLHYYLLCYFS